MKYKGLEVNFVSNFTDVDDKIIKAAIAEGAEATLLLNVTLKNVKDMKG